MASTDFESRRSELETALTTSRPHFSWVVRFDQGQSDLDRTLFIASRNDAGKTWQLSLPAERLETDDVANIAEEIVEGMDDELSG